MQIIDKISPIRNPPNIYVFSETSLVHFLQKSPKLHLRRVRASIGEIGLGEVLSAKSFHAGSIALFTQQRK